MFIKRIIRFIKKIYYYIMSLCGLRRSLKKDIACQYTLNSVKTIYLANKSDVVTINTDDGDCGEEVAEIVLKDGKYFYLVEPSKDSASYSDTLTVNDNVRYRTHTLTFSVLVQYDAEGNCDIDGFSLGEFIAVAELASGNAVILGNMFTGLKATTAEFIGSASNGEFGGFNIVLEGDVNNVVLPVTSDAISLIKDNLAPEHQEEPLSYKVKLTLISGSKTEDEFENGEIPSQKYLNRSNIASVEIGNGITEVGLSSFANCSRLSSVTLSDSLTVMYASAFANCTELTTITIPSSVTEIDNFAFSGDSKLSSVSFNGTKSEWNSILKGMELFNNTLVTKITCTDGDVTL